MISNTVWGEYYQNAHDTLIKNMIVSSESLDEKFNDLEVILGRLNENKTIISNWESQGEILYDFIQIRKEYNKYKNEYIDEYGTFRKSTLNRRVRPADDLDRLIRRLKTLIHSFKKFRVEDLSETAKAVKTEIKRILLNWDTDLSTIQSIMVLFKNQFIRSIDIFFNHYT